MDSGTVERFCGSAILNERNHTPELPAGLPSGSQMQGIRLTTRRDPSQRVLLDLPAAIGRHAIAEETVESSQREQSEAPWWFLSVPSGPAEEVELLTIARAWVEPDVQADRPTQVIMFQGLQLVWTPRRVAILASPDRMDMARRAVIESACFETELSDLERELAVLWPDLSTDMPLAFEFNERSVRQRRNLLRRFQQILMMRARLARLSPFVLAPHIHPPTLTTQIGERLRERLRMTHRLEAFDVQLEVFERVYEGCGQRASEFMLARTGHTLEWIIIILLLTQTILVSVDLMMTLGK